MSAGNVAVVTLLSAQTILMCTGIWRASAWVARIEDRLRYLERLGNGLHDEPKRKRA